MTSGRWPRVSDPTPDGRLRAGRQRSGLGRAWWIWGIAASAYFVAMIHRMALGVAGPEAAIRFDVPLGSLAIFTSLQLTLYLVMQIPAGLLADRFGPRRTLAIGLGLMAIGELLFAVAESMPLGLTGRGLVGIGDALTFLNVLRLAHAWFPSRLQTLLAALTGVAGAVGQLVSTVPLEASLVHLGWTGTFLALGGGTAVLVLLPLTLVRNQPQGADAVAAADGPPATHRYPVEVSPVLDDTEPLTPVHEPILRTLIDAWHRPATRQGFFLHMGALGPFLIVAAVWGLPYLTQSQGMTRAHGAHYLLVIALAFAISGPLVALIVRDVARRLWWSSLIFPAAMSIIWAVLLLWPGAVVPEPVLMLAFALTGVASSGSMLAFELARRAAPAVSSGSATALVNCGGFTAAVIGALLVGWLIGDGTGDPVTAQRAMLPVLGVAVTGLLGAAWSGRSTR